MGKGYTLIDKVRPLLQRGWRWTYDYKLVMRDPSPYMDGPWINGNPLEVDCRHWQEAFWEVATGMKWVHSHCQSCYKVVCYPRTVVELFKMYKWQRELPEEIKCKCGCDRRDHTGHLYGAYFYTRSIEQGKHVYRLVRDWADENYGSEATVLLKRACTEFERALGPSDKWEITEEQKAFEEQFDAVVMPEKAKPHHPDVIPHHLKTWIEFAFSHGDETYLELTGGEPMYPPYVTYHEEKGDKDGADRDGRDVDDSGGSRVGSGSGNVLVGAFPTQAAGGGGTPQGDQEPPQEAGGDVRGAEEEGGRGEESDPRRDEGD